MPPHHPFLTSKHPENSKRLQVMSKVIISIGVGETCLKINWLLAAGRENADTWTYLQRTPRSLRNLRQEQRYITGFHLGMSESIPPALFY
jgi:hypothetical protein